MTKKRDKKEDEVYKVHTDGSALGNPGPGGYGAVIRHGEQKITLSKGFFLTTNNRQELMAVLAVLKEFGPNKRFEIYADSYYVINGCTKWWRGWKRNNWRTFLGGFVKNADLWKDISDHLVKNKVKFFKVKAHSGVPDNEEADKLAKTAAKNPTEYDSEYKV